MLSFDIYLLSLDSVRDSCIACISVHTIFLPTDQPQRRSNTKIKLIIESISPTVWSTCLFMSSPVLVSSDEACSLGENPEMNPRRYSICLFSWWVSFERQMSILLDSKPNPAYKFKYNRQDTLNSRVQNIWQYPYLWNIHIDISYMAPYIYML